MTRPLRRSFALRWRLWQRWRQRSGWWFHRRISLAQLYRLWACIRAEYGADEDDA